MQQPVTALYIHFPFCRVRCAYCDFNTYAGLDHLVPRYVGALIGEAGHLTHHFVGPLETVYLGGGTPSGVPARHIGAVLAACGDAFGLHADVEISVEANPGSLTRRWLDSVRAYGVNRLSLGVQSLIDAELTLLGRLHRRADVTVAVADARAAGFDNLSLDLIFGLPGQSLNAWRVTLEGALELAPEHLSLYALTLEDGTPLADRVHRRELPAPDPDLAADMYELASDVLDAFGFRQYEISNWCRPGYECAHNRVYWRYQPYLGLGGGAHSFDGARRWWNVRSINDYLERLDAPSASDWPSPAAEGGEILNRVTQMGEMLMLGLRLTQEGVSEAEFRRRFGLALDEAFGSAVPDLIKAGLVDRDGERLRLTPRGRLLGNRVFARFLPEAA